MTQAPENYELSQQETQSLLFALDEMKAELEMGLAPAAAGYRAAAGEPSADDGLAAKLFRELGCEPDAEVAACLSELFGAVPPSNCSAVDMVGAHQEQLATAIKGVGSPRREGVLDKVKRLLGMAVALNKKPNQRPWCDLIALDNLVGALLTGGSDNLSDDEKSYLRFLKKVDQSGLLRDQIRLPAPAALLELAARFPHFAAPARFIAEQLACARLRRDAGFRLPPILLAGPAGTGKTHFCMALAAVLGTRHEVLSMASQSCGFAISGMDRGWSGARAGLVFDSLLRGPHMSPLIVLDEIDKAQKETKSDPIGPLYTLLEPNSAKAFRDEYAGFPIDASQVIWIATANDASVLPAPLASRFVTFEIAPPTAEHLAHIADQLLVELAQGLPLEPHHVPPAWHAQLRGCSIRAIRLALQQALGRAAMRAVERGNRVVVLKDGDLQIAGDPQRRRIGFCQ